MITTFIMPTDKQLIEIAILFNDGKLEEEKLSDMVAMSQFILDRLFENRDVTIPSYKEVVEDIKADFENKNKQR